MPYKHDTFSLKSLGLFTSTHRQFRTRSFFGELPWGQILFSDWQNSRQSALSTLVHTTSQTEISLLTKDTKQLTNLSNINKRNGGSFFSDAWWRFVDISRNVPSKINANSVARQYSGGSLMDIFDLGEMKGRNYSILAKNLSLNKSLIRICFPGWYGGSFLSDAWRNSLHETEGRATKEQRTVNINLLKTLFNF